MRSTFSRSLPYRTVSIANAHFDALVEPSSSTEVQLAQTVAVRHTEIVMPLLQSLLPSTFFQLPPNIAHSGESHNFICQDHKFFSSAYLRLLVFSVANNFAGLGGLSPKEIWAHLKVSSAQQLLNFIQSVPGPMATALGGKLFRCAVEAGDAEAVDLLLQDKHAAIMVNDEIFLHNTRRYTPVELSATLQDVAVARVLVRHGAEIGKTYNSPGHQHTPCGALCHAIKTPNHNPVDHELLTFLLQVGAEVSNDMIDILIQRRNIESIESILKCRPSIKVNSRILEVAVNSKRLDFVRLMLDRVGKAGRNKSLKSKILYNITGLETLDILELLRQRKDDFHLNDPGYDFRFQAAAEAGNVEEIHHLLRVSGTSYLGASLGCALYSAIEEQHTDLARLLLDSGADLDTIRGSALAKAIEGGNITIARAIIELDPNLRPDYMLGLAVEAGDISIVKHLISAGANINFDEVPSKQWDRRRGTPLALAIAKKDYAIMNLLLDAGAEVDIEYPESVSPLLAATKNNDLDTVTLLLSIGADPADSKALLESLQHSPNIWKLLLSSFLKIYPRGKRTHAIEALVYAVERQDVGLVMDLLKQIGFKFPVAYRHKDMDPLKDAIETPGPASLQIVRELLSARPGVDQAWRDYGLRETPLLAAINAKRLDIVKFLVQRGANINLPATTGIKRTSLQKACEVGDLDIIQWLLDHGAEVNAPPSRSGGATALQLAAIGGYAGIVELLLQLGADIIAAGARHYGRTALEGAAENGRLDTVKLLLDAGVETDGPGLKYFENAIKFARKNGHHGVLLLLKNHRGIGFGICGREDRAEGANVGPSPVRDFEDMCHGL